MIVIEIVAKGTFYALSVFKFITMRVRQYLFILLNALIVLIEGVAKVAIIAFSLLQAEILTLIWDLRTYFLGIKIITI